MEAPRNRVFGPARIVAVVLISLTTLGLAYLHFSGGDDPVSVPSGAHAGQLTLHACHYATEAGSYPADCGTLVVPESRNKAHSRLIALPNSSRVVLITPSASGLSRITNYLL